MSKSKKQIQKDNEEMKKELEKVYVNVTEDGGVRKLVIVPGDGPIPKENQEVAVHYNVTLEDGTVVGDSFEKNNPLRLTIGGEASIRGVQLAVATMRLGEKICLELSPEYGYGAMDNPWGFHGYGVRIPPNSKLIFELQMFPVDLAFPKTTTQWVAQAETNKLAGNKAFEAKDDETAKTEWETALKILENVKKQLGMPPKLDEKKTEEEKQKIQDERNENETKSKTLFIACHSNLAAVHLRAKRYDNAKEHCRKVLEVDENNVKAIFRLALAHKELQQYESAIQELTKAADIQNTKDIQKELTECKKLNKEKLDREKEAYTGMFNKLGKEEGLYEGVEPGKPPLWKCHYCGEEMQEIQKARHIIKMHSGEKRDKVSKKDLGLPDQIPLDIKLSPV